VPRKAGEYKWRSKEWTSVAKLVTRHQDLLVYKRAFELAMQLFELSKNFPREEIYSLTDQMRRSSRSICANIAEAWRKRRYEAAFVAKLSDCEGEAAETQTWLEFAVRCGYLERERAKDLFLEYDDVIAMLVSMIVNAKTWVMPLRKRVEKR
jgi:four helix bundle protein